MLLTLTNNTVCKWLMSWLEFESPSTKVITYEKKENVVAMPYLTSYLEINSFDKKSPYLGKKVTLLLKITKIGRQTLHEGCLLFLHLLFHPFFHSLMSIPPHPTPVVPKAVYHFAL